MCSKKKRYLLLIGLLVLAISLFTACAEVEMPDYDAVQKHFEQNKANIYLITDYLVSSGYENVYIDTIDGYMLADLNRILIGDDDVLFAVRQILTSADYLHIHKQGNTVSLLLWRNDKDVGCGIAYSINNITEPDIEFMTQMDPLTADGWYYYVSDYNKWRTLFS